MTWDLKPVLIYSQKKPIKYFRVPSSLIVPGRSHGPAPAVHDSRLSVSFLNDTPMLIVEPEAGSNADCKNSHVVLQKELELFDSGGLKTNSEDQRQCDNRIERLKRGIRHQQRIIEEYEKVIQSGELQGCGQQDVGKQEEDLPHLQEQYEQLQQQLKAAQMELVLPGKSSEKAYARFYGV